MSLKGKSVVFTGTLTTKRAEAKRLAEAAGATVLTSVSITTNVLVAGPDAVNTGKVKAAEAKNVLIWTEADFLAALKRKGSAAPKAPAAPAASAAPLKRPAAAVAKPAPAPVAKRAKTVGDGDKPLHGQSFYRAGFHRYQLAVGDFVRSLGGAWTKNPKQASYYFAGIGSAEIFSFPCIKSVEAGVPILAVPFDFTRGKASEKDKQAFFQAMRGAEELSRKMYKEGMTTMAMSEMLLKEFKLRFPDYYAAARFLAGGKNLYEEMVRNENKLAAKLRRRGTLVNSGKKLEFQWK